MSRAGPCCSNTSDASGATKWGRSCASAPFLLFILSNWLVRLVDPPPVLVVASATTAPALTIGKDCRNRAISATLEKPGSKQRLNEVAEDDVACGCGAAAPTEDATPISSTRPWSSASCAAASSSCRAISSACRNASDVDFQYRGSHDSPCSSPRSI